MPHLPDFRFVLKGSPESRILNSVFYDFGRSLQETCPFSLDLKNNLTTVYLRDNVRKFARNFPNLQLDDPRSPVHECRVPVGALMLKPEAYLRMNARAGFVAAAKRAAKMNQSSQ